MYLFAERQQAIFWEKLHPYNTTKEKTKPGYFQITSQIILYVIQKTPKSQA